MNRGAYSPAVVFCLDEIKRREVTVLPDKKDRPQNKNLIPLSERSPEEARAIRQMGKKAADKKRRENADARNIVRQVMSMGMKKGYCCRSRKRYVDRRGSGEEPAGSDIHRHARAAKVFDHRRHGGPKLAFQFRVS